MDKQFLLRCLSVLHLPWSLRDGAREELRREMTPAERILWKRVRAHRLNALHFRRQQIVHGYLADFLCHQQELIVEVDGGIHELQQEYDAERAEYLKAIGFRIIRFKNEEITKNLKGVLQRIVEACQGPNHHAVGSLR